MKGADFPKVCNTNNSYLLVISFSIISTLVKKIYNVFLCGFAPYIIFVTYNASWQLPSLAIGHDNHSKLYCTLLLKCINFLCNLWFCVNSTIISWYITYSSSYSTQHISTLDVQRSVQYSRTVVSIIQPFWWILHEQSMFKFIYVISNLQTWTESASMIEINLDVEPSLKFSSQCTISF